MNEDIPYEERIKGYTLHDLQEVLINIDKDKYPGRVKLVEQQIAIKRGYNSFTDNSKVVNQSTTIRINDTNYAPLAYLYYRIYRFTNYINKKNDPLGPWYLFCLLQGINLVTIINFLSPGLLKELPKFFIMLIGLPFFVVNYFIFIWKDRYKIILDRYKDENQQEAFRGIIWGYVYALGSFGIFLLSKSI